ncbi:MAG: hypothetical protein PHQ12_04765 [Chthoniobacteraceae bacterium]|nr:hypothetical protein [Chthoniobacteraceae bacterium]
MSDRLLDLQHAIKAYLDAQPYFSNALAAVPVPIPVVTEDAAAVESMVNRAVAEVQGICVLIRAPGGKIPSADNAAPVYDPAVLHVRIYENPVVNRADGGTMQPACKVGDAIIRILYGKTMEGFSDPLAPKSRAWGTEDDVPFYDLVFETVVPLDDAPPTRDESLLAEDGQVLDSESGNAFTSNP